MSASVSAASAARWMNVKTWSVCWMIQGHLYRTWAITFNHIWFRGTHVRAGSPSSCVCTACSSTPRLAAACPCGRPPMRGRLSAPEPPGPPPAAPPPAPASSGGPPDSPRSRLQQEADSERCSETRSRNHRRPAKPHVIDPEFLMISCLQNQMSYS